MDYIPHLSEEEKKTLRENKSKHQILRDLLETTSMTDLLDLLSDVADEKSEWQDDFTGWMVDHE
jgi:t-SNARE complex subunit (syntaxin)